MQLRASEAKNAAVTGEYQMYKESYALVVGIDAYTEGWPRLSNAVKDAELIAAALEEKGFDVELHRNLDSDALMQVFKRFFILKGEKPDARLFVWFAGHGATVDGEGYLVPADAPIISEGASFKFSSLALRDFGTYMRQSSSKHVYAVFDSCFAGTVFSAQRALPPAAITRATTLPVRQFLTSGDADQTVSDDGQFRDLFIRAIRGEERSDANADGYLTASELGMYLGDRVTNLTESAQTPRYGKLRDRDFDRGDFVFALPTAPDSGSGPTDGAQENEIVFWNLIKDSDSSNEYAAYLSQFPNGQFAQQATVRQNQLQQSANLALSRQEFIQQGSFEFVSINRDLITLQETLVREIPHTDSSIVGRLPEGTRVWGLGEYKASTGNWYDVSISGVRVGFLPGGQVESIDQTDRYVQVDETGEISDSSRIDDQLSRMMYEMLSESSSDAAVAELDVQNKTAVSKDPLATNETMKTAEQDMPIASALTQSTTPQDQQVDEVVRLAETEVSSTSEDKPIDEVSVAVNEIVNHTSAETGPDEREVIDIVDSGGPLDVTQALFVETEPEPGTLESQPSSTDDLGQQPLEMEDTVASPAAAAQPAKEQGKADAVVATVQVTEELDAELLQKDLNQVAGNAAVAEAEPIAADQDKVAVIDEAKATLTTNDDAKEIARKQTTVDPQSVGLYARRYLVAAAKGNVGAQLSLGYMYENGDHVLKDLGEAEKWYRRAAEMENVNAMIGLASLLGDAPEATLWFRKAAEKGNAGAQEMVAYRYQSGTGADIDPLEAVFWYKKAAGQNKIAAQNNLGRLYQLGIGVEKDLDQAIFWYEKAAEQGSVAAQNNLKQLLPSLN
ncbi:MAG: caspase family protein [Pseudomonadota bacterium]|nr:caspase family protein [Pseudomonadota bacterium]